MYDQRKPVSIILLFLIVLCACDSRTYVDWYFTIPNDYYGFLVIRYDCPNGKPLSIQNGKIGLEFNDDGTACISGKFLPTSGQVFVKRKDGKSVPYTPREGRGYGLLWIQSRWAEREGIEYGRFEVLWAGNVGQMGEHYSLEGLDEFLEERFGVPQIKIVVTPTPRSVPMNQHQPSP